MFEMAGLLRSSLRIINVLVVHLLLAHFCRGQSQLTGPPQPIVAAVGDDTILPCRLQPAADVAGKTLEWTRPELDPRFVFVWRTGQDLVNVKNPSYKGRTSLYTGELKHGNISLKLSSVKPSDEGRYKCYIPALNTASFVELVVASRVVSWPTISLSRPDRNKGAVVLQCNSTGWYPEPEVFWLDAEGNLLSAGPTEAVRGPDDLYTVSSRVTVEKRHSNSFTCRVQQNHINQTRETLIHVPDDFFEVQSSSSSTTAGLAVSLAVCILVILILGFFVWKFKTERSHGEEPDTGVKTDLSEHHKSEDQCVTEPERQQLMTHETVQMKDSNEGPDARIKPEQQQRREAAENRVKLLKEELETKKTELKQKQADLQQLHEEKQRKEENLQRLKERLENKNTEVKTLGVELTKHSRFPWGSKKKEEQKENKEAENEVENLKKQLETGETELDTKTKEIDDKQVEVEQLQGEIQRMETKRKCPMEELSKNQEWPIVTRQRSKEDQQKLKEEQQKLKEEQQKLKEEQQKFKWEQQKLKEELKKKTRELQEEKQRRDKAEAEVLKKNQELQDKTEEMGSKDESIRKLLQERRDKGKAQREVKTLKNQLESKNTERESEKQDSSSSVSQSSTTGPAVVFKVDPTGKCIQLMNTSTEDQRLGGWALQIQVNDSKAIKHTFKKPFNLKAKQLFTVGFHDYPSSYCPAHLVFKELRIWNYADKVQVSLISDTGKIQYNLDRID